MITNDGSLSELEMLLAYKSQPALEKRFSHLKTDFEVAPVYLKEASRIQALLCVYFLALLTESLLERELRRAMDREAIESLPLYPEGRKCRRPTARRLIDLFDDMQRRLGIPAGSLSTFAGRDSGPLRAARQRIARRPHRATHIPNTQGRRCGR